MGIFDFFKGGSKDKNDHITKTYHENGKLELEGNFKGGKKEGLFKVYHENGKLKLEGNYKDGELEGLWKIYHENGKLEREGNYKDGELEGLWKFYHENGKLKLEVNYKNGKEEGLRKTYHENGELLDESNNLVLNTQKFTEFKNTVKNLLDSNEDVSIYFYIYKWDTIEKQETYDEDWRGIKYKGYWDMILENAVMELAEIKELYEIIKVHKTLDQLRGDDFDLFFSEDDGGNRENIKIDWERPLTDEEKKSFEDYGGIEELAQDSEQYDNEDVTIGRISMIEIIVGDKKYST